MNNRNASDLRRHCNQYGVTVIFISWSVGLSLHCSDDEYRSLFVNFDKDHKQTDKMREKNIR